MGYKACVVAVRNILGSPFVWYSYNNCVIIFVDVVKRQKIKLKRVINSQFL